MQGQRRARALVFAVPRLLTKRMPEQAASICSWCPLRAGIQSTFYDCVSSMVEGELTRNRLNSNVACIMTFAFSMLCRNVMRLVLFELYESVRPAHIDEKLFSGCVRWAMRGVRESRAKRAHGAGM